MKHITRVLGVLLLAFAGSLTMATAASATEEPHNVVSECLTGWYTNPDEGDRLPESTEDGLVFEPADLVHHAAGFPLAELTGPGGTFVADPNPGTNFRFSVEVGNTDYSGYATLHWDGSAWFVGGKPELGTKTDASQFEGLMGKWGAIGDTVLSFGVGYTQTPPGDVDTTVASVTFRGTTYDLTCAPEPEPTVTPTPTPTTDPSPSSDPTTPTNTETTTAATLPVTGVPVSGLLVAGVVLLGGGAALVISGRLRRQS